jgi:TolA-binding protein
MNDTERKDMWLKTVVCQRMRRDLEAAHATLTQLVELYPDCPQVAQLARQNYREYLQNQCTDAPVLEKLTSLDGDD